MNPYVSYSYPERRRTAHLAHGVLTLFTCGMWAPIWALAAMSNYLRKPDRTIIATPPFAQQLQPGQWAPYQYNWQQFTPPSAAQQDLQKLKESLNPVFESSSAKLVRDIRQVAQETSSVSEAWHAGKKLKDNPRKG